MMDATPARSRSLQGRLDLCSINTATLGHRAPVGEIIDAVARAGFGGIAPWRREIEGENVRAIGRRIADAGLQVSGYCRSSYFPAPGVAEARAAVEANRRALHDAAELGARCFVLVVGGLPQGSRDLSKARSQVHDGVGALLDDARRLGVPLALEPLHPMYAADRSCLTSLGEALDLCDRLDGDGAGGLGVAIDVYHVWWDAALPGQIRRAGKDRRILAFHVCDWLVPTTDMLLDRGMMGDGVIDIAGIRAMVEATGYRGAIETEIFSATNWWQRPAAEILEICAERVQTIC